MQLVCLASCSLSEVVQPPARVLMTAMEMCMGYLDRQHRRGVKVLGDKPGMKWVETLFARRAAREGGWVMGSNLS